MEYFLFFDESELNNTNYNGIPIGEESFNVFYCDSGFDLIEQMINDKFESISECIIFRNDDGKRFNIQNFLKLIEKLEIRKY